MSGKISRGSYQMPTFSRIPNQGRPVTQYLILFLLSVLIPALAISGFLVFAAVQADKDRANREALQLSRSIASMIEREIEGSNESLLALASSPALQQGNFDIFHAQMRSALQMRKRNAMLSDLTGRQLANTRVPWGTVLPPQDPQDKWFADVVKEKKPMVSDLVMGAVAKRWVLAYSVPVFLQNDLRYVLTMSVEPDQIAQIISDKKRDNGWLVVVTDRLGRIIAHSLGQAEYSGQMAQGDGGCQTRDGSLRELSAGSPKREMVRGFHCVDLANWRVTAQIPAEIIDAPYRTLWSNYLLMAAGLLLSSLPLAYLAGKSISKPIAATAILARKLGEGHKFDGEASRLFEASVVNSALSQASKDLAARSASLTESEARFRSVFDQAAVGFEQVGLDGQFLAVNDRLCKMLGYTSEECLQKSFRTVTHLDDCTTESEKIRQLVAGDINSYTLEKRMIDKSGSAVWARVTSSMVKDEHGRALYRSSVVEDVTDVRRQGLEAGQLAAIVEASPDAMLSLNLDGHILTWNPGAEALLGYKASDIVGMPISTLVPPSRHQAMKVGLGRCRDSETIKFETVKLNKNGDTVDVSATLAPIKNKGDGPVTAISLTMEDIRQRKLRDEQIDLLNRELAHRVKNSLAVVQSLANQTLRSGPSPEQFAISFQGRLQTLAAATDLLTQTDGGSVNFRGFAYRILNPVMSSDTRPLRISGEDVILPPELSVPIGLALYELGTNAMKYGAWSVEGGKVELSLKETVVEEDRHLIINWTESGTEAISAPTRQGFGSVLIEKGIPGARVTRTFAPGGMHCVIDVQLQSSHV